jgi:hypothetical protein
VHLVVLVSNLLAPTLRALVDDEQERRLRVLLLDEAVAQTPLSGLSLWQITTARSRRKSNQSGRAVDHRETALQELGQATRNARL